MYTYPFSHPDLLSISIIMLGTMFVHACFQLSVSVLTLLNAQTIARRLPNSRVLNLNFWYILGVAVTVLMLSISATATLRLASGYNESITRAVVFTVVPLVALAVVLLYYRRGKGTRLWLPRHAAEYITTRAKKTRSSMEAFSLGFLTVVSELPFAMAPLLISALVFTAFPSGFWVRLSGTYALGVVTPLIFVAFYISSGHKVSAVQHWREDSKGFLKWTSALTLLLLTVYVATLAWKTAL